jgi:uncharacterized protein (DUF697 family)
MADAANKGWLRLRIENALRRGLTEAYDTVKVDPAHYLQQLRSAYAIPIVSYQGVFSVPMHRLDEVAAETIRAGMKMAAAEGAGLGLGGMLTLLPDLGILAAITLRTIQKLSLTYGFEFNTEDEIAELWIAAASAAGVDIGRELLERQVVTRFVPRVISRLAVRASGEVEEKWAGRVIPVLSSVIGGSLNWYFVHAWGERALSHFREKHLRRRDEISLTAAAAPPQLTAGTS